MDQVRLVQVPNMSIRHRALLFHCLPVLAGSNKGLATVVMLNNNNTATVVMTVASSGHSIVRDVGIGVFTFPLTVEICRI
jgi:hypothetical protein